MHADVKIVGWWALYASALLVLSGALYLTVPGPGLPELSVTAKPAGFEPGGSVELTFHLSRPALEPFEVPFAFDGDAVRGEHFDVADPSRPRAVIKIGDQDATLELVRKTPPKPDPDVPVRKEEGKVIVALKPLEGVRLKPDASRVDLSILVERLGPPPPPYTVSVSADATAFNPNLDRVTVRFRLDRKPTEPVTLDYTLAGDARPGADYDVETPAGGGHTLTFKPDQDPVQAVVLKRRPRTEVERGLGDRAVEVSYLTSRRLLSDNKATIARVTVPDPKAELSWSVEPEGSVDRSKPSTARLRLTVRPARGDRVTVRYTATPDAGLEFEPKSAPGTPREFVLEPRATSVFQDFKFAGEDLVGGPPRRLHIEPVSVEPRDAGDPARLGPKDVVVADDRPLAGPAVVIVVLTADLAANSQPLLAALETLREKYASRLAGGSFYVLAGDKNLYRFRPEPGAFQKLPPFAAPNDYYETILNAAERALSALKARTREKSESILVWQDFTAQARIDAPDKFGGIPDTTWRLLWVGPNSTTDKLGKLLKLVFKPVDGAPKFHEVDRPENLTKMLGPILNAAVTAR